MASRVGAFGLSLLMAAASGSVAFAGASSYRELVTKAKQCDLSIDFRALRLACLKDDACDPRGDSDQTLSMKRAMQSKEYEKAAKTAEALIDAGFVNIEAQAVCSQADEALGNAEKARFHHAVAASLIHSILSSGDGKTKATAFEVIGTFEEHIVLSVLGLPPFGSQALLSGKPHSYDLIEVEDPKTHGKVSVYFNIDAFFPMKGL